MATSAPLLASEIAAGLGHPGDVTVQVQGFATGILEELTQNGVAGFNGGVPSPYSISGMSGSSLATKVASYAGYPFVSPELLSFCTGIVTHIQGSGIVTYVGPPPPANPNYFLGGTISGLVGATMASIIQGAVPYPFVSAELLGMSNAICNHIVANAQVVSGVIS